MFSKLGLFVALTLAISASARPAEKRWGGSFGGRGPWWQPSKASSYLDFAKRAGGNWGSCDLNNALPAMNLAAGQSIRYSNT
jgi:hypothetical protein